MEEPLAAQFNDFLRAVRTRSEPRAHVQRGVRVVKILSAAQKSLKSGGAPVAVEE